MEPGLFVILLGGINVEYVITVVFSLPECCSYFPLPKDAPTYTQLRGIGSEIFTRFRARVHFSFRIYCGQPSPFSDLSPPPQTVHSLRTTWIIRIALFHKTKKTKKKKKG